MNGKVAGAPGDPDLFLFLARHGVDVYALDYRTHFVSDELSLKKTDSGEEGEDLSFMAGWGMETFTTDALAALAFVRGEAEGLPVFVGGFSRGVAFAYAVAAAEPKVVRGVVALDGYFKRVGSDAEDAEDRASRARTLQDPSAALAAGKRFAHDVGGSRGGAVRQRLMHAAGADPSSPALGTEGTVGEQLAGVLYEAWGPGALANPIGSPQKGLEEGVSRIAVLARLMAGYDRFYPLLQDLEGAAWAKVADHPGTPIDDGWPTLRKPVFFVGSTGMGAEFLINGLASASHCARAPEIHVLEGHGHLDVLVGKRAEKDVFEPMLDWIRRITKEEP